jgi:hypothetical protein
MWDSNNGKWEKTKFWNNLKKQRKEFYNDATNDGEFNNQHVLHLLFSSEVVLSSQSENKIPMPIFGRRRNRTDIYEENSLVT